MFNDDRQANIYEFQKYIENTTCVQKLKSVLAFKRKKPALFQKHQKKVV